MARQAVEEQDTGFDLGVRIEPKINIDLLVIVPCCLLLDWCEARVEPVDFQTFYVSLEHLLDCFVLLVESGNLAAFRSHPAVLN